MPVEQCYACKLPLQSTDSRSVMRAPIAPERPGVVVSFHARCWLLRHQRRSEQRPLLC